MNIFSQGTDTVWAYVGTGKLVVQRGALDHEGHTEYRWEVWDEGTLIGEGADLRTGVDMDHGPVAMLATLTSFLAACAESDEGGENYDLFNGRVREWAYINDLGLAVLRIEIEEGDQS